MYLSIRAHILSMSLAQLKCCLVKESKIYRKASLSLSSSPRKNKLTLGSKKKIFLQPQNSAYKN